MKRQAMVTINDECFELKCSADIEEHEYSRKHTDPMEIYQHYDRPSESKVSIWGAWVSWANELIREGNNAWLTISSANCMQFSIKGECLVDGAHYILWITKCHNRAYRIS